MSRRNNPFDPFIDPHLLKHIQQTQKLMREYDLHSGFRSHDFENLIGQWRGFNDPTIKILRDAADQMRNLQIRIPSELYDFRHLGNYSIGIDPQILRNLRTSLRNFDATNVRYLAAFSEVTSFLRVNKAFLAETGAFGHQVIDAIEELETRASEDDEEGFFQQIEKILTIVFEQTKLLKPGSVTAKGVLNVIFTLSLFFYSLNDNRATEQRLTEVVNQSTDKIIAQLKSNEKTKELENLAVIMRPVKLQISPRPKSPVIQLLSRNQVVKIIQTAGKWIYVEYFDYVDGLPKNGWIMKKYSKRVSSTAIENQ